MWANRSFLVAVYVIALITYVTYMNYTNREASNKIQDEQIEKLSRLLFKLEQLSLGSTSTGGLSPAVDLPNPKPPKTGGKEFAYAFYGTDDEYSCGAIIAHHRLVSFGMIHQADFIFLYGGSISESMKNRLQKYFIMQPIAEGDIQINKDHYYRLAHAKILIFKLYQYKRVIFMDADSLVMKPLEHLFLLPSTPLAAPWAYWEIDPCFTSLLLVIEPSEENWKRLSFHFGRPEAANWADMDLLIRHFAHSFGATCPGNCRSMPEVLMLPSNYGLLSSHLIPNATGKNGFESDYYLENWPRTPQNHFDSAYLIHFSGCGGKPWMAKRNIKTTCPGANPLFYQIWNLYLDLRKDYCEMD